jgi:hypothetical protein
MTDHLPLALRSLWHELPLLAVVGVLTCTATSAVVLVIPGINPGSVLLAAVLVAPLWGGVMATADSVVRGGAGGVVVLMRNLKRCWIAGFGVGLVPAGVAAVALANWEVYVSTHSALVLLPLAVSGCVTVLVLLAAVSAFSLRVTAGLRGKSLWFTSLTLVARAPAVPLGILALAGIAVALGTSVTASLLLLAPGPVALFAAAGTWTTYTRSEIVHDALHR